MDEEKRLKVQQGWDVYKGEGLKITSKVVRKFKKEYGKIPGLKVSTHPGIYHGGIWVITVQHPFIFDHRKLPKTYLGIEVRGSTPNENMPEEFRVKDPQKEYVWSPECFEKFVDKYADKIRKELNNSDMSREEMLDAICFGNFKLHVANYKKWKQQKLIP